MEAGASLTDASVLYLYGFVSLPVQLPAMTGVEEDAAVFLVEYAHIGCAVSVVSAASYQRDDRSAEEQVAWLTPRAWRHHDVMQQLHASGAVLPLKFGTLCGSLDEIRMMLRDRHVGIGEQLARLAGKDEWTLRVTIDRAAFARQLQASEPPLIELQQEERRLPEGRAYFTRKRLEKLTMELAAARLTALETALFGALAPLRLGMVPLDASSGASAQSTRWSIAETALLVDRDALDALSACLAAFEEQHSDPPVRCELVGPWPPYSFATALE